MFHNSEDGDNSANLHESAEYRLPAGKQGITGK